MLLRNVTADLRTPLKAGKYDGTLGIKWCFDIRLWNVWTSINLSMRVVCVSFRCLRAINSSAFAFMWVKLVSFWQIIKSEE